MIYQWDYKTIKILMADDDADILAITAKKVAEEGFIVITAKDGEEAWQKIQSDVPDVVVLDLMMPKIHGLEVLKKLRESPPVKNKWQPVIIVSGERELETMNNIFKFEADHYIKKPCRIQDIVTGIKLMVSLIPHQQS